MSKITYCRCRNCNTVWTKPAHRKCPTSYCRGTLYDPVSIEEVAKIERESADKRARFLATVRRLTGEGLE